MSEEAHPSQPLSAQERHQRHSVNHLPCPHPHAPQRIIRITKYEYISTNREQHAETPKFS